MVNRTNRKQPPAQAAVIRLIRAEDNITNRATDPKDKNNTDNNLRAVTAKQDAFAYEVGYNLKGLADGYRLAYNVDNMSDESIRTNAYRESHKPHVAQRISEYTAQRRADTPHDPERLRTAIAEGLYKLATEAAKDSDRLKAFELLGKVRGVGMFSDVVEQTVNTGTDEKALADLKARIAALTPAKPKKQ